MKKQSNLTRLLAYAGGYKRLTVLGCVLSGVAAILGLCLLYTSDAADEL